MPFVTKEFTMELLENNIISHKVNEGCTELTLDGALEAIEQINDLIPIDSKPTKLITYIQPFYVNIEVIKCFTSSIPKPIALVALVCPGYVSKYVASIAIKMYHGFYKNDEDDAELKIFTNEGKAMEWLNSI